MTELYHTTRPNIVQHIRNVYADGELDEPATCKNFLQVRQEGNRQVTREIPFYKETKLKSKRLIQLLVATARG